MTRIKLFTLCFIVLYAVAAVPASGATVTRHETEADFLAALDPAIILISDEFDGFPAGTLITNQIPGVLFSSPNSGLPGFTPIQTLNLPQAVSKPNALGGGSLETKTVKQAIVLDFLSPASAVAFYVIAQNPTMREITVELEFVGEAPQTLSVRNADRNNPIEFFGITSDMPFARATIISNDESGGLFQSFGGIDNLHFGLFDVLPPICTGAISTQGGILGVDGRGTDDRPGDSGIGSVDPDPTNINLDLTVDPFAPGDPFATFRVQPGDPNAEAVGKVLVSDVAGNSCELCLNFRNLPQGPTLEEVLCCADGLNFFVNNEDLTPPGPSFCSNAPHGPAQPILPFGYEPSKFGDPFPCTVLTIDSPISGETEMIMIKDGDFDPDLRMLASSSLDAGFTFPPFKDVTLDVIPKLDVDPDPTKLRGKTGWSVIKVACAVLAERCDGVDNDGDGLIDEGLPVGDSSIDVDGDGWPLCNDDLTLSDCEDQNPDINPAGTEVCNGLDDNCDGSIDENNPDGGEACNLPDLLGVCADGETLCDVAEITCVQSVFPTAEACNRLDDDCDGGIPADEVDADGDGFTPCEGDCNDNDATIFPGATELCNGVDDDCDGAIPADESDGDGDGFRICDGDCDDADATSFPGAPELCDGIDNDCDGSVPADEADVDGDGFRICAGDCNDGDASINPAAAEVCDAVDNDCDGTADDGNPGGGNQCGSTDVGVCQFGLTACTGGAIVCVGNIEPLPEVCGDGLDNDCNGAADESLLPVAACSLSLTNFNVTTESTAFKFNFASLVNACDAANPVALDPASIAQAWISRAGNQVLPDPSTRQCPDPINGFLGETGIFENLADRQVTGNDVDLKFNGEADGDCRTQDGSRQEMFALLSDVVNDSTVSICFSSTIDGVVFECCGEAKVTNHGNR